MTFYFGTVSSKFVGNMEGRSMPSHTYILVLRGTALVLYPTNVELVLFHVVSIQNGRRY